MKLFFVVPYAPTVIRTRPHNLLRALAQRGHALTLATVWENPAEQRALEALAADGIQIIAQPLTRSQVIRNAGLALPTALPLQARYCWQPALARAMVDAVTQAPEPFDVVHIEHLRGAEYGRLIQRRLRARGDQTPIVWDSVDCISLLFEQAAKHSRSRFGRWITRFELPRTRRYESAAVRFFSGVLATSPKDQAALEALATGAGDQRGERSNGQPAARVTVLANGVDVAHFVPAETPATTDQIVLTGKMSYHANVTAALHLVNDIMPLVWQRCPGARVLIVGSAPPREVRELAVRHAPRVSVTGFVPDLRPYLQSAAVAVAPVSYGAGIQNKVLEAMACGVPVVASRQASSALQAQPGQDLLVADGAEDFAASVRRLLEEPARRIQIGQAGRQYVLKRHPWHAIAAELEDYYHGLRSQVSHNSTELSVGGNL